MSDVKSTESDESVQPQTEASLRKRKVLLGLLGVGIVVSAAAYGAYYFTVGRFHASTDDAYVSGNLIQLTPQVSGTVIAVNADDTQIVKKGDPVVALDPADSKVALANAEAQLGQTVRQVSGLYVHNSYFPPNVPHPPPTPPKPTPHPPP